MIDRVAAVVVEDALCAPMPGWFRCTVATDRLILPGDTLGELEVLGRIRLVIAPNVRGLAVDSDVGNKRAVGYGDVLLRIGALDHLNLANAAPGAISSDSDRPARPVTSQHVFSAPTSGRFFSRPGPGKPAFVSAGSELTPGCTICLLEVMKTFHRVAYAGVPARVRRVLVEDGAEVSTGTPLLELEDASPSSYQSTP